MFGVADPRCLCPDIKDLVYAELIGEEFERCPVHQSDDIAARQLEADTAALEGVIDTVNERHNPAPPASSRTPLGGSGLASIIAATFGAVPDERR